MSKQYSTIINDGDACSFCGAPAKFRSKYTGNYSCELSANKCPVVRAKNSKGLSKAHKEGKLNTSHLSESRAWSKGLSLTPDTEVFIENSRHSTGFIKKRILKERLLPYQCQICKVQDKWMEQKLILELDHINGNSKDNRLENLRFLCPNCHSQTFTFRGRNINKGGNTKKISDKELLTLLEQGYTIRQSLNITGLAAKGGNYKRVKTLLNGGVA